MDQICPKRVFPVENRKIAFVRAPMVVTYYVKLFCMGADRHNNISISLLLLFAETIRYHIWKPSNSDGICLHVKVGDSRNFVTINTYVPAVWLEMTLDLRASRRIKIERITIFIFSFCVALVTQLSGPALGVLKHHYITKRIGELLIGNSRFLIYIC